MRRGKIHIEYILSYFAANTTLNLLVGGVIGGVVVVWRLAMAVLYLLKMAVAGTAWSVRKLAGAS